jgi:hypothetical protein
MDLYNKFESEVKSISPKRVIGEKKRGWLRTGLKVAGGLLGGALLGGLGYKASGDPNTLIGKYAMSRGSVVSNPAMNLNQGAADNLYAGIDAGL